jgi:hypothetical protein
MAHDDPFTLDLFGNTALSSGFGLGLGVTAFAGDVTDPDDDDPDPSSSAPALPVAAVGRPTRPAHRAKGTNFHLAGDRALAKGWKDRRATTSPRSGLPPPSKPMSARRPPRSRSS